MEPFVDAAVPALGLDDALAFKLRLMLEELVVNALTHGGGASGLPVRVEVALTREPGALLIELQDSGVAFDPTQQDSPDVSLSAEEREIGGLGIHFVRQIADEIHYARVGACNHLTLRKRL